MEIPFALTWEEWNEWHTTTQMHRPIAYLAWVTIPKSYSITYRYIKKPYLTCKNFLKFRFIKKYHMIDTGLGPGYHNTDSRMLYGMFMLLTEYIEKEMISPQTITEDKWWHRFWPWSNIKSSYTGLELTKFNMLLNIPQTEDTDAVHASKIAWELYHWWKYIRPARPNPKDISGYSQFVKDKNLQHNLFTRSVTLYPELDQCIEKINQIEEFYKKEDDDMLIKLLSIRTHI